MSGADLLFIFSFIILPTAILVSCIWALVLIRKGVLLPPARTSYREQEDMEAETGGAAPEQVPAEPPVVAHALTTDTDADNSDAIERTQEVETREPIAGEPDAAASDQPPSVPSQALVDEPVSLTGEPDESEIAPSVIEASRPVEAESSDAVSSDDEREITEEFDIVPGPTDEHTEETQIAAATADGDTAGITASAEQLDTGVIADPRRRPVRRLLQIRPTENQAGRNRIRTGQRRQVRRVHTPEQSVAENEGTV